MTPTPTPTEELKIRQMAARVWSLKWANATDLTPEQAFSEAYMFANWCGIVAGRQIRLKADERIRRLQTALNLSLLCMCIAIALVVAK